MTLRKKIEKVISELESKGMTVEIINKEKDTHLPPKLVINISQDGNPIGTSLTGSYYDAHNILKSYL